MPFGEPHRSVAKRVTYWSERVGKTKLRRVIVYITRLQIVTAFGDFKHSGNLGVSVGGLVGGISFLLFVTCSEYWNWHHLIILKVSTL